MCDETKKLNKKKHINKAQNNAHRSTNEYEEIPQPENIKDLRKTES